MTYIRICIKGSTSPVVAVGRVGRGVGGSLAARLGTLQGPGRAASRTRLDRGWKSKSSGSEEDAREDAGEEGHRNHADSSPGEMERCRA